MQNIYITCLGETARCDNLKLIKKTVFGGRRFLFCFVATIGTGEDSLPAPDFISVSLQICIDPFLCAIDNN